jgi:hypothetical protein
LERAYDGLQTARVFFAALAALGMGILMLVAPLEELREFEHRHLVGWGAVGLGAVMLVALLTRGSRTRGGRQVHARSRALLLLVVCAAVLAAGLLAFLPRVLAARELAADGVAATAEVIASKGGYGSGSRTLSVAVRFDGHTGTVRTKRPMRRGETVDVLYLPHDPSIVALGRAGDGFLDLLDRDLGLAWSVVFGLLTLAAAGGAAVCLRGLLLGGGDEEA